MHKMSQSNTEAAFAGESQAHVKYSAFAARAELEGFSEVARLFRAVSFAEQVHATNHLKVLGALEKTETNLAAAIDGETYEVQEMYPAFIAVSELQEEKAATRSYQRAIAAEKVHASLYQQARQAVMAGDDARMRSVHVCSVCGWTLEGEAPDRCPLCGAKKEKFVQF